LHAKAKGSPGYRFYLLHDKVYRRDVLDFAFARCRAGSGQAIRAHLVKQSGPTWVI